MHAELCEKRLDVDLHRTFGELQAARDLLVRHALYDEVEDVPLSGSQYRIDGFRRYSADGD